MVVPRLIALLSLMALAAAGCGPAPTAPVSPRAVPAAPVGSLTTDADRYPASTTAMDLTLTNEGSEPFYTAICGPWEIVRPDDPGRPVWAIACEIDYLGHRIDPGQSFTDRLEILGSLSPGTYQARVNVYAGCSLGEPVSISASETNYGEFSACTQRYELRSALFVVE